MRVPTKQHILKTFPPRRGGLFSIYFTIITKLKIISKEIWSKFCYDIQLYDFESIDNIQNELSAVFSATGRWAFESNLEYLGDWTADEVKDNPNLKSVYEELLSGMSANNLKIEVSYSDEEAGCLVLYRQNGTLLSDGNTLVYEGISTEDFAYNWENYIEVTNNLDAFNTLLNNLREHLGLNNTENDLISRWIKIRTFPHCEEFDELGEDIQAEFMEIFRCKNTNGEIITNMMSMTNYMKTAKTLKFSKICWK